MGDTSLRGERSVTLSAGGGETLGWVLHHRTVRMSRLRQNSQGSSLAHLWATSPSDPAASASHLGVGRDHQGVPGAVPRGGRRESETPPPPTQCPGRGLCLDTRPQCSPVLQFPGFRFSQILTLPLSRPLESHRRQPSHKPLFTKL